MLGGSFIAVWLKQLRQKGQRNVWPLIFAKCSLSEFFNFLSYVCVALYELTKADTANHTSSEFNMHVQLEDHLSGGKSELPNVQCVFLCPPLSVILVCFLFCFVIDSYNFNEGRDTSKQRAFITCAAYHKLTHILITGFDDGSFTIHEMPDFNLLNSYKLVLAVWYFSWLLLRNIFMRIFCYCGFSLSWLVFSLLDVMWFHWCRSIYRFLRLFKIFRCWNTDDVYLLLCFFFCCFQLVT